MRGLNEFKVSPLMPMYPAGLEFGSNGVGYLCFSTFILVFTPAFVITIFYVLDKPDLVLELRLLNAKYQGLCQFIVYIFVLINLAIMYVTLKIKSEKQKDDPLGQASADGRQRASMDKVLKTYMIILVYFAVSWAPYFTRVWPLIRLSITSVLWESPIHA